MPNFTIDPITGIQIPTPSVDPGPDYSTNVSNALTTLAHLTHTGAAHLDGYQIPSAGLNINADVSFQSNNITSLRSSRYTSQSGTLSGSGDVNCVYVDGGNLFYNNGSGTPIQITSGGALDVTVSNNFNLKNLSSNYTIQPSDGYIVLDINTSTSAVIITLPLAVNVAAGRFYIVKDGTGNADTHHITINCAGSDTIGTDLSGAQSSIVLEHPYAVTMLIGDGVSSWLLLKGDQSLFSSGETLQLDSGSTLSIQSGATVSATITSGTTHFTTGSTFEADGYVTIDLQNSSSLIAASSGGEIEINSGGVLGIFTGGHFDGSLDWLSTTNTPTIKQDSVSSGAGQNMRIESQATTAAGQVGGNLQLFSGASGSGGAPSAVQLQPSGAGGVLSPFQVFPFQGTQNTQNMTISAYSYVCNTGTSADVNFATITLPNDSAVAIEVFWVRRPSTTPSGTTSGNRGLIFTYCTNAGATNAQTNPIIYASSGAPNTDISVTSGTNSLTFTAVHNVSIALDWQIQLLVNLC